MVVSPQAPWGFDGKDDDRAREKKEDGQSIRRRLKRSQAGSMNVVVDDQADAGHGVAQGREEKAQIEDLPEGSASLIMTLS
jgi:archaellum component FlaD/FlaE